MVRIVFLILVFLTTANSKPRASFEHVDNLIKKYVEDDVTSRGEENPALFEGDIVIDEDTKRYLLGGNIMSRDAVVNPIFYWPNGVVYYTFDSDLAQSTIDLIKKGFHHLRRRTCLKFVQTPRNDGHHSSYIKFFSGNGCYSRIGRDPNDKEQVISIGLGCERLGTVVHETMHALGFFHEHTRPDRDKYITLDWGNIEQEHAHNFQKYPRDLGSSFGKPYDYHSVMHYSKYAFAKHRDIPTIVPKEKKALIGQRFGLSLQDREEINKLYRCKEGCVDEIDPYKCVLLRKFGMCSSELYQQKMIEKCPMSCDFCGKRDSKVKNASPNKKN